MKPKHKLSVTWILWEIFPFDQDMKTTFMNSLAQEWIERKRAKGEITSGSIADQAGWLRYDDVMEMLCTLGTTVHSCAFDLGTLGFCNDFKDTVYEKHVNSVIQFFKDTWAVTVAWEVFIETEDYYGISDGIINIGWRNILVDFKTWTAYKALYGIANKILKKDGTPYSRTDDIKKVSLQLSLYKPWLISQGLKIDGMMVIWFTEQGYFTFDCVDDLTLYNEWRQQKFTPKDITNIWKPQLRLQ